MIAVMPMPLMLTIKAALAMSIIQSSSPVQVAARNHTVFFVVYVGVLVLGAILTVLVWRSGNKYQDAVNAEAATRITNVETESKERIARIRTESDERIASVEAESKAKILGLQTDLERARTESRDALTRLAKAQEEAARAQLRLEDTTSATYMRTRARMLDTHKFMDILRGVPKAKVEVLYSPNDSEAWNLAWQIAHWLGGGDPPGTPNAVAGVGWTVFGPVPLSENNALVGPFKQPASAPLAVRAGVGYGVGLVVRNLPNGPEPNPFEVPTKATGARALWIALERALELTGGTIISDPSAPPDVIRVIVGPRMD